MRINTGHTLERNSTKLLALLAGGMLMAVPLIHLTGRTVRANLTLDAGLLAALDAEARARKMSRSALVAAMARREIG